MRTSARRSRPMTTSLPAANVRADPSYRTVSAGGAGRLIGTNKAVTEALERVEHWLVPAVFIGLGLFILIESGVIVRLIEVLA